MGTTHLPLPLSARARRTHDSPINALIAAKLANPDLINFAAGLVDDATLPVDEVLIAANKILADRATGQKALQYGTTIGLLPLREALLSHLEKLENKKRGEMSLGPNDLILTTGSQQALLLIADVLLDPGDIVITANPSYFVFAGVLEALGATVIPVPMDDQGMDVGAVAALLDRLDAQDRLGQVKFVYCTSYFDNPTGRSLSLARRKALLDTVKKFSREHRILILEDGAYRELLLDGPALPSIKSFDAQNQFTILTQTFSKPFSPGIKLGYTAMPADLLEQVLRQKGSHDFGSSNLCQEIALKVLTAGDYQRHLEILKNRYREKRDLTLRALEQRLGHVPEVSWTVPGGGLYVWLTLPEKTDTSREGALFAECVRKGVLYVPGVYCFHVEPAGKLPRHHIRLCYGQVALEEIEEGVKRLAEAVTTATGKEG